MKGMGFGSIIIVLICMGIHPILGIVALLGCALLSDAKDSYDAYKHPYQAPDCFKPKPWQQDWIDKNKK